MIKGNNMQEQLTQALTVLLETIQTGVEWSLEQAPEVIHQLLLYKTIVYGLTVFVALIIAGIATWAAIQCKNANSYSTEQDMFGLMAMTTGFISMVLLLTNVHLLLKILIAPKVWLLEYIKDFI